MADIQRSAQQDVDPLPLRIVDHEIDMAAGALGIDRQADESAGVEGIGMAGGGRAYPLLRIVANPRVADLGGPFYGCQR